MNDFKQKIIRTMTIAALAVVFLASGSIALASEITSTKMLELTNKSRSEAGLDVLASDEKLLLAAQAKAEDMFKYQYFEHTSPQGVTPWFWFDSVGYDYVYAAENLALDFTTAEGVHSALMKSTGHRENILGINYEEVGIAVVSGTFKGKNSIIVVEEFGTEREQKKSRMSDAFFEDTSAESAQLAETKPQAVTAAPKTKQQAPSVQARPQVVPNAKTNTDEVNALPEGAGQQNAELSTAGLGKVMPEIYSVRSASTLKKVYVENIYWEETDGEGLSFSLDNSRAILKALLRDLTNGLIQSLINR